MTGTRPTYHIVHADGAPFSGGRLRWSSIADAQAYIDQNPHLFSDGATVEPAGHLVDHIVTVDHVLEAGAKAEPLDCRTMGDTEAEREPTLRESLDAAELAVVDLTDEARRLTDEVRHLKGRLAEAHAVTDRLLDRLSAAASNPSMAAINNLSANALDAADVLDTYAQRHAESDSRQSKRQFKTAYDLAGRLRAAVAVARSDEAPA